MRSICKQQLMIMTNNQHRQSNQISTIHFPDKKAKSRHSRQRPCTKVFLLPFGSSRHLRLNFCRDFPDQAPGLLVISCSPVPSGSFCPLFLCSLSYLSLSFRALRPLPRLSLSMARSSAQIPICSLCSQSG